MPTVPLALTVPNTVGHYSFLDPDPDSEVNDKDNTGWTALMYAAENGHTASIVALIEARAEVHAANIYLAVQRSP